MKIVLIIVVMANSVHHDYTVHTIKYVLYKRGKYQIWWFSNRCGTFTMDKKAEKLIVVTTITYKTRVFFWDTVMVWLTGLSVWRDWY